MTVEQAIEEVRRVGSLTVAADGIRYEIRNRGPETANALRVLKERKAEAMALLCGNTEEPSEEESLESLLSHRAVELWSTASGRLFLVADEEDARRAKERCRARRGEIYTAAEARRIVAVHDPAAVAEIQEWKRQFDGVVREARDRGDSR